jgi:hypothetical protein
VTKLRGDVHSLEETVEEEKEEEDVTMVEEESVEVLHSKKKNKKRKLDTSEELPGKAMHSLFNRSMSIEEYKEGFLFFYVLYNFATLALAVRRPNQPARSHSQLGWILSTKARSRPQLGQNTCTRTI